MGKQKRIVICKRCGREKQHFAKEMCRSCYCYVNNNSKLIHCNICGRDNRVYGGKNICQSCKARQSNLRHYEEYKKRHAESEKRRRVNMGEEYNKKERERNKQPKRKKQRALNLLKWQRENKDRLKDYRKEYRQKQTNKVKVWEENKRIRKKGNGGFLSEEQWKAILKKHNHSCYYCKKSGIPLEQEHKTPLSRGGRHDKSNVVPACRECNARKYMKTEEEFIIWMKELQNV